MSGHEILLAVAVFCFAWQRRMSLGQGGVDWDGGEKSGFALYILIYWSRLIDGRALYRGLAFPVGRTTSWRKNRKERKGFRPFVSDSTGYYRPLPVTVLHVEHARPHAHVRYVATDHGQL